VKRAAQMRLRQTIGRIRPATRARAPVAVGGVGGSGTRLVAQILADLGYSIGPDINDSNDNLTFTLLFKTRHALDAPEAYFDDLWTVFRAAMTGAGAPERLRTARDWRAVVRPLAAEARPEHPVAWLEQRFETLEESLAAPPKSPGLWCWKEPNTHLVVERLLSREPALRYIHVVRNGLDVAFSANQHQLEMWGQRVLGRPISLTPRDSLAYWVATHRRIEALAAHEPERVMLLNYDALCRDPAGQLEGALRFLRARPRRRCLARASERIEPPSSLGRHRDHDLGQFDPDDLAYVRRMGFATGG
jgi:hypothetical protein